jgi:hypothetical protein
VTLLILIQRPKESSEIVAEMRINEKECANFEKEGKAEAYVTVKMVDM